MYHITALKEKLFVLPVGTVSFISNNKTEKSDLANFAIHFTSKNHCHRADLQLSGMEFIILITIALLLVVVFDYKSSIIMLPFEIFCTRIYKDVSPCKF